MQFLVVFLIANNKKTYTEGSAVLIRSFEACFMHSTQTFDIFFRFTHKSITTEYRISQKMQHGARFQMFCLDPTYSFELALTWLLDEVAKW